MNEQINFTSNAVNAFREFLEARPGENLRNGRDNKPEACIAAQPMPTRPSGPTVLHLMGGLGKEISEAHDTLSVLQNAIGAVTLPPPPASEAAGGSALAGQLLSPAGEELASLIRGISELNRRMRATIENINL